MRRHYGVAARRSPLEFGTSAIGKEDDELLVRTGFESASEAESYFFVVASNLRLSCYRCSDDVLALSSDAMDHVSFADVSCDDVSYDAVNSDGPAPCYGVKKTSDLGSVSARDSSVVCDTS